MDTGGSTGQSCAGSAPLVTVITVVRNGATVAERTLKSVISQRDQHLEYIVIDGGSTDGTVDLLRENDHAIDYWISESDDGIYDAMNKGIAHSSGDYLLFLNAGDELVVNLKEIEDYFKAGYVIVYGKASMLENDGRFVYTKGKKLRSPNKMITGMRLCHQAIFYRRDAIGGGYDAGYRILADRVLTHELMKKHGINRTLFIDKVICTYYEGGFSRQNPEQWKVEEIRFLRSNGRYLYAEYRRLSWFWKKMKRAARDV
ncbi:glycosyltransferase family 2 protein [Geobacter sp. DSM 9736]|uniref:glycosyltransferase family 2 protein n=1 Tax=Geobacter sp. DSM 9736 TaxID=1277350 RepID=UPI000B5041B7|nr:glycosyltransferase family 2 protein [Geobacter sp. DSM 9736]SNB45024.1 Glycosyltransferase involved in cell wall bisynthesis [Geobacter sp. DSM 9736]